MCAAIRHLAGPIARFGSRNVVHHHRYRLQAMCTSAGTPMRSIAMKPRTDELYGEVEYWNKRYAEEAFTTFDWYQCYADLAPILKTHIPKTARVLMAGCGNAVMSTDMVADGYQDVVNIDYSPVLIDALKFKNKHIPQLTYKAMDVRRMSEFRNESFDAAIDKGLYDAMVCAPTGYKDVAQMMKEIERILKPGGNFVLVTYGFPLVRVPMFLQNGMNWSVNCWILPMPYIGRSLTKYPAPIAMEFQNWIHTRKEQYDPTAIFVYVATKR